MGEPKDFATFAAELEGDAVAGAGALRSTYAARMAALPVPGRGQLDRELEDVLGELRTRVHDARASLPAAAEATIQLEVTLAGPFWRVRLVERRGGHEVVSLAVRESSAPLPR